MSFIQIDFHQHTIISGLVIQGDPDIDAWVSLFVVSYSTDCEHFRFVTSLNGTYKVSYGYADWMHARL